MKKRIIPFLIALLFFPCFSFSATFTVTGLLDGDTIRVLASDGQIFDVRLFGIDCPETAKKGKPGQAYGNVAKQRVNELIRKRAVELDIYGGPDRYGRTIAIVWSGNVNINETLVREGMCMVYPQYCKENFCSTWKDNEIRARQNGLGIFADPHPTPPWQWRRNNK
jgi:endonuclease YncB( thermonuclease family)